MQMSTDGGKTFKDTTSVTMTTKGTVIARLRDASNNYGGIASKTITNIDKDGPTGNNAEIKNVTSSGYDVYVYNVTDNGGSGVDRVQFPTWTELNSQDDIQSTWATNSKAKGTLQSDGTIWVYHVNIADHNNENGKYNSHIYAYDKLGNSKQLGALSTTVPAVAITWNANGGTSVEGWNKQAGSQLGTLPTSSRTGYTFAGWFTAASGGTQISTTSTVPSGNVTYYAHWNINSYSVTCEDYFVDASNGRKVKLGTQAAKSYNYGTSVSGTAWGTDATISAYYSGYVYKGASSVTLGAGNATVYRYFWAWTDLNIYYAGSYTQGAAKVSFSVNKTNWVDVTNESNTVQPYGTTYYIKNIRPVNDTEELDRVTNLTWDSTNGYYYYTPTAAGTAMNIYMKYKNYSISYNLNGGSVSSNPTSYNVSTADFTLNNPTRTGYTFTGWTGSNGTTAQTSVTIPTNSYGNKSYTANWSVNQYTVTFNPNGGSISGGGSGKGKYNYGSTIGSSMPISIRTGYTMTGYYTAASGGTAISSSTVVSGDVTYYAQWKANTYTIKYNTDGGNGIPSDQTATYDQTISISTTVPRKVNYKFLGWYDSTGSSWTGWSGTWKYVNGQYGITNNTLTLTAKWKKTASVMTFIANGGTVSPTSKTYLTSGQH